MDYNNLLELDQYLNRLSPEEKLLYVTLIKYIKSCYTNNKDGFNVLDKEYLILERFDVCSKKIETLIETLITNLNVLLKEERCKKNSYTLGKEGENRIFDVLKDLNLSFEKMFTKTKSGDFVIKLCNNKQCVVEVKNYKSRIPQKEIDKFINDLDSNEMYSFGIIISLYSESTSFHLKEYSIYKTKNNKYTFLNYFNDNSLEENKLKFSILLNLLQSDILYNNELTVNTRFCVEELYKGKNAIQGVCNNLRKTNEDCEHIKYNINNVINILEINGKNDD